jgi:hypothetical protein
MTVFKCIPGKWALYDGNDDLPFDNPRAYLSRVHAHSDFDYIQFSSKTPTIDTSIFIPPVNNNMERTIFLGNHGKSGIPFVFGRVNVQGTWIPLNGSTPVFWLPQYGDTINFNLAVSNTGILIHETRSYPDYSSSLPSGRTVRVQVWVSDNIVDGSGVTPSPYIEMRPNLLVAGRLDSRKYYLRRKEGASLRVSAGRTWTLSTIDTPHNTSKPWQAYRYDAGFPSTPINFTSTTVDGLTRTDNSPPTVNPVNYACMIGGDVDPFGQKAALEIEPGAGYARVVGSDGTVVLDTREEIFHILSKVQGEVSRPRLVFGGSAGASRRYATIPLGSVDPSCTGILGLARITYSTDVSYLPSGYWYVVGGSLVTIHKTFQSLNGSWSDFLSTLSILSFVLNGSTVELHESTCLKDDYHAGPQDRLAPFTITYRLFCGTFT